MFEFCFEDFVLFFSATSLPVSMKPYIELSSSHTVSSRQCLSAYFHFSSIFEDSVFKRYFALETVMTDISSLEWTKTGHLLALSSTT